MRARDLYLLGGAHPPDLILLDVRMEGVDGFETCRRLKADPATSEIPVILITASTALSSDSVKGLN
ncbi:MAG: response regulator, partial [Candidatus Rokuibacteriota bacterium]